MKKFLGFLVVVGILVGGFYALKAFGNYMDEQNEKLNHEVINNILDTYEYSYTGDFNQKIYNNFTDSLNEEEAYLVVSFYVQNGVSVDACLNNYMFKELTDAVEGYSDRVYIQIEESSKETGIVLGFRQFDENGSVSSSYGPSFNFLLSVSNNTVGATPKYFVTQDHIDYVAKVMSIGALEEGVDYTYESYWTK